MIEFPYRVYVLEDDDYWRANLREDLARPGRDVTCFESLYQMIQVLDCGIPTPDLLVADVAALSAGCRRFGVSDEAYVSQLRSFLSVRPGVLVGLYSMLGHDARDIVDLIRESHPDVAIHHIVFDDMLISHHVKAFVDKYDPATAVKP